MQQIVAVKTFLTNQSGQILVLRRSETDPHRPGGWDLPGGWVDDGEDFTTAAVREMQEEAGIVLHPGDMTLSYAMTFVGSYEPVQSINRLYFTATTRQPEVILSSEHDAFEWLSTADMVTKLTHPPHAQALAYVLEHNLLSP